MLNDPVKRNVLLLAICQALYVSGTALMISTAPLVGQMLAEDPGWATAPLFFHHGGVMTMTIPASLLMRRVGRRTGFMLGAVFGCIGALVAVEAIYNMSYWGFCLGAFLIGWFNGFAIFYRFAAADTATREFRPKAISLVLAGGLLAAVIGPELGKHTLDWLEPVFYAGSYLSLVGLYVLSFCIVAFVRIPTLSAEERRETGRPLPEILRQPTCVVAILAAAASYAAMSLVMSPAPLAMLGCGFTEFDALTVMQVHMVGMYLPAFFTGHLVSRFGARPVIFTGIALLAICGAVNLSGIAFVHFAVALFLNGVGWNFMFVGGSSLLTEVHTAAERAKLQGVNDFVVFGSIALSSLFSGRILEDFGWNWINIGILPMIAVPLLATLTLARPSCPRNN